MNNYCVVGKLKLVPVEGAKTLQLGYYGGLPYAVGKDFDEDTLYAIFVPDGQLSQEYFEANKEDLSFFGKNLKVRSIKLMKGKIKSVGYVAPLESLSFTGYDISKLKEGDSFNELNGVTICSKYVNPNTKRLQNQQSGGMSHKREMPGLLMHPDTNQFYRFANDLQNGDLITITLKLDGTSVRIGNVYEPVELSWWQKLLGKFVPVQKYKNKIMPATRKVIIEKTSGTGYYGNHDIYKEVGDKLDGLLYPGESVYGEIVGWLDEQRPLFKRGGVVFKYGCVPGERDFYVYNIRWTLPDGQGIDLPWSKIKRRCAELGVKHVPEVRDSYTWSDDEAWLESTFIYNGNIGMLERTVYNLVDGPDFIDPSHIREGVVVRVEGADGTTKFYKAKSEAFYALEDKSKNDGDVDIEEAQDV